MRNSTAIRVSYLITTRNRATFLQKTLDNVRDYFTPADEVIVVDGASSDNTEQVILRNSDIVTEYLSEPDSGEAHGYNKGILLARGQFIKLITDDDYLYPEAVRTALRTLEEHPAIEALVCGGEFYEADLAGDTERLVKYVQLPPGHVLQDDIYNVLQYAYCGVGLFLRRAVIAKAGLLNTSYLPTDLEYMTRLIACRINFYYLDIKLYHFRAYSHSGHRNWPRTERDILRILLQYGAWERLSDYSAEAVGRALGLWSLPGGPELMNSISVAEAARQRGWRAIMRGMLKAWRLIFWLQGLRAKMGQPALTHTANAVAYQAPLVEPTWDGGLR